MKIYLVGGAVRDKLLNRPVKDRDWVVVGASPAQMLAANYKPVGKDFPVFLHPETHEEYALARTERKSGKGYHGFTFFSEPSVTLEQDLIRRDLTINAIAQDEDGNLVDPFNGVQDIKTKTLRHVSDAFREDPLRVLRVARFYARYARYGFTIAKGTLQLMCDIVAKGEISHLTPERVWIETEKALGEPRAALYFQALRSCGVLEILFPEIERLFGVPNPGRWHPEICTGVHTMLALEQACLLTPNPVERFAALCHDVGKGLTAASDYPSHPGHEQGGEPPINQLCQRLKIPNKFRDLARIASRYHTHVHRLNSLEPTTIVKMFQGMDAFRKPERVSQLALVSKADATARPIYHNQPYPNAELINELFHQACDIDAAAIAQSCSDDRQQIPTQIYNARVSKVKNFLRHVKP